MPDFMQGLVGCQENLVFCPGEGGSPRGLWEEAGWYPTQVLTGDLWPLLGGQTMEDEGRSLGEGTHWVGEYADPGKQ